jgi:hypothetical protein
MFYAEDPSLSFIGLPRQVPSFPLADVQASLIARVLSGAAMLPSPPEMQVFFRD